VAGVRCKPMPRWSVLPRGSRSSARLRRRARANRWLRSPAPHQLDHRLPAEHRRAAVPSRLLLVPPCPVRFRPRQPPEPLSLTGHACCRVWLVHRKRYRRTVHGCVLTWYRSRVPSPSTPKGRSERGSGGARSKGPDSENAHLTLSGHRLLRRRDTVSVFARNRKRFSPLSRSGCSQPVSLASWSRSG
jgi:hypothetical protein